MNKFAIATATMALAALAPAASAGEYCVVCNGPEAIYKCQVDSPSGGNNSDPRQQLLCASELAKLGGHESCSVNRKATDGRETCAGELRVLGAPASPLPAAPPSATNTTAVPAAEVPGQDGPIRVEPPPSHPDKVPETMEELAGQTMKNSKENLKKAGDAIGGTGQAIAGGAKQAGDKIGEAGSSVGTAAKKTWNCLTSLFSDC